MKHSKKIAGAIATAAAILSMAVFVFPSTSAATAATYAINPSHRYILADTGASISLSSITAAVGSNSVTGDQLTWKPADSSLTVSGGAIKAATDGVHKVNISIASYSADVYVVTKQASASEYVLYQENFDTVPDGQLPDGWAICDQASGSTAAVQNKQLVLDSSVNSGIVSVRMPSFLAAFDNYTAEADFCLAALHNDDPTRYCSLEYRMQIDETQNPATYVPSCLMTVRQQKTGDSIEMTGRPTTGTWDQANDNRKDHGMKLDTTKFYKDKVSLYGNRVQEYFNNTLYIDYTGIDKYPYGGAGLLSGGSKSIWDNIKISIQPENLTGLTPTATTTTAASTTTTAASTTTTAASTTTTTASTNTTAPSTTTTDTSTTTTAASTTSTVPSTTATAPSTTSVASTSTTAVSTTNLTATTTVTDTTASTAEITTTTAKSAPAPVTSETSAPTTASQQSPKTGSAAFPAGVLILTAASAMVVLFNSKKR